MDELERPGQVFRQPVGVVLAGGQSRRMGGQDKPTMALGGQPLFERVAERLSPQVETMAVNANGETERFGTAFPVFPDVLPDQPGPLAGVHAALKWADAQGAAHVVTVPADTPFIPADLVERLIKPAAFYGHGIVIAADDNGVHPLIGIWSTMLDHRLAQSIAQGTRRVRDFIATSNSSIVHFQGNPFYNINTPDDLKTAEAILG